ncbi:MAG: sigma-70 family RNA polymerase sigma factor [Planctomycetes bacterium]|nr:sigma-70 family RNA polymerase sigma factor [Planctomycetota bacterium]
MSPKPYDQAESIATMADETALLASWTDGGDEAALSALLELHRPMVTAVCQRILRRTGDADDAIQETFITLAEKAATIQGSVGGWLRVVATRHAVARLRAIQRQRTLDRQVLPETAEAGEIPTDIIAACLAELTEAERDLIVRLFYLGESQAEIARLDRSSRLQIHRRLQHALARLRALAKRRGLRIAPAALLLLLADGNQAVAAEAARTPLMAIAPLAGATAAGLLIGGLWLGDSTDATAAASPKPSPPPAAHAPLPASSGAAASYDIIKTLDWAPGLRIPITLRGAQVNELDCGLLEVAVDPAPNLKDRPTAVPSAIPTFSPLIGSAHVQAVLVRWRDGRESVALRCTPPPGALVWIRPLQSGTGPHDRHIMRPWPSGKPGEPTTGAWLGLWAEAPPRDTRRTAGAPPQASYRPRPLMAFGYSIPQVIPNLEFALWEVYTEADFNWERPDL